MDSRIKDDSIQLLFSALESKFLGLFLAIEGERLDSTLSILDFEK